MQKIINPFSVSLNRNGHINRYNEVEGLQGRCVYRNGDYTIWKKSPKFFNTCYKNIIITQTVGAPRELVDALVSNAKPTDATSNFHYERMKQAISDGLKYAKENNIQITTI